MDGISDKLIIEKIRSTNDLVKCILNGEMTYSLWKFELFESIDSRIRERKINRIMGNSFDWEIYIDGAFSGGGEVELRRIGQEVHWRRKSDKSCNKIQLTKKIMN